MTVNKTDPRAIGVAHVYEVVFLVVPGDVDRGGGCGFSGGNFRRIRNQEIIAGRLDAAGRRPCADAGRPCRG